MSVHASTILALLQPTHRTQAYTARIYEVNSTLHMVTIVNPDALAIAAQLDAERANGTIRGLIPQQE